VQNVKAALAELLAKVLPCFSTEFSTAVLKSVLPKFAPTEFGDLRQKTRAALHWAAWLSYVK
jgi:hypothetical protein